MIFALSQATHDRAFAISLFVAGVVAFVFTGLFARKAGEGFGPFSRPFPDPESGPLAPNDLDNLSGDDWESKDR